MLHDVGLDEVRMLCVVLSESGDVIEQEAGLFVEDVHVINAKLTGDGSELFACLLLVCQHKQFDIKSTWIQFSRLNHNRVGKHTLSVFSSKLTHGADCHLLALNFSSFAVA